jgi:hypothetical protein
MFRPGASRVREGGHNRNGATPNLRFWPTGRCPTCIYGCHDWALTRVYSSLPGLKHNASRDRARRHDDGSARRHVEGSAREGLTSDILRLTYAVSRSERRAGNPVRQFASLSP